MDQHAGSPRGPFAPPKTIVLEASLGYMKPCERKRERKRRRGKEREEVRIVSVA